MTTAPLITRHDRSVPITVQRRSPLSPADAFAIVVPIDLASVFPRIPGVPVIAGVERQTGAWDHAGASRYPRFSDGSQAFEQLTEYTTGHSFAYQLTGFTNVLRRLTHGVRGEWTFTPDGDGTVLRWTYEFQPRRGRRWILAGPFVPLWRILMRRTLANIADAAERG
ncbi:SRPBCC family protein [Catenuloplanes japonicus]|uniref:SRPBCC family protein n=1 Tax=Catenuloplanes japonicus TaxID=33876 RepID=UPI000524F628|nr:SRPBCC family protein [Catenuloplanes japonicus]